MTRPFIPDNIPAELRERSQWVLWRWERTAAGKLTKVPYDAWTGKKAATTNPKTWAPFTVAWSVYQREAEHYGGVGYVFAADDPYFGGDADDCINPDTGELAPWAVRILAAVQHTYAETSPSGTGVKFIGEGALPRDEAGKSRHKKTGLGDDGKGAVELYDRLRFFTITGRRLPEHAVDIADCQAALNALYAELFPPPAPKQERQVSTPVLELDDRDLIDVMFGAKNGADIRRLWKGDLSGHHDNHSEADLALLSHIAFYTGDDPARLERIFGGSALAKRDKWRTRKDYRDWTVAKALEGRPEFYSPRADRAPPHTDADAPPLSPDLNGHYPGGPPAPLNGPARQAGPGARIVGQDPWPAPLDPAARYGLVGSVVAALAPHTEADPAALLFQFLAAFGNAAGRHAYFRAEADRHYPNLFVGLIGDSAKGRKGSSWGHIAALFAEAAPTWRRERIHHGLSSGEGLIWQVRDPISRREPIKQQGRVVGYQDVIVDAGIEDKRILVLEAELAQALRVLGREGNTLSPVLRCAWDNGDLGSLVKNSPARSTGAHVSLIGHITRDELLRYLDSTEAANGFMNRFCVACVRRSKVLPEGGSFSDHDRGPLVVDLTAALDFAHQQGELRRDDAARTIWREVYPCLSEARPGLLGAVIARAEAQVMRLALIYALLDRSVAIKSDHLSAGRLAHVLQSLTGRGLVRAEQEATGGRPAERWFAATPGE